MVSIGRSVPFRGQGADLPIADHRFQPFAYIGEDKLITEAMSKEGAKRRKKATKKRRRPRDKAAGSMPGEWAMANRQKLLAKNNPAEEHLCKLLAQAGIVFNREHVVRCNGYIYFIDAVADVDGVGLVGIEIDGTQHFSPTGQREDRRRERDIIGGGEVVGFLRTTWPRILKMDHRELVARLKCLEYGGVLLHY